MSPLFQRGDIIVRKSRLFKSELKVLSFINSTQKICGLVDWWFVSMIDQSIDWLIVWLIDWLIDWLTVCKMVRGRFFRILHLINHLFDIKTWLIDLLSWFDHFNHDLIDWSILCIGLNDTFCIGLFLVYTCCAVQWQISDAQF